MTNYRIHDCTIQTDRYQILSEIDQAVQLKQQFLPVVTLNMTMFPIYYEHPSLFSWLKSTAYFTPDGISLSVLIFQRYFCWRSRYPGIDMVHDLFRNYHGYRVAMIGATPDTLTAAAHYFTRTHESHELVYTLDGFTNISETMMQQLKATNPDVVLIALGCPKQDAALKQLSMVLSHGVGIGVGGVFDVWAGAVHRAPMIVRWLGLEWLYRITRQPKRMVSFLRSIPYLFGK